MNYQDKLRTFADFLDAHPTLAERMVGTYEYPSNSVYVTEWEEFQEVIGDMGGFEKGAGGGQLSARHTHEDEDGNVLFYISVTVSGVCELVPKVDDEGMPVMRKKTKYVETDEYEQEMEYNCPTVWTK